MENAILASLSQTDRAQLHLKDIDLRSQQLLYEAGDVVNVVYFPRGSIISLVVALSSGETVEAAMVGMDGIVGAAAALDGRISLSRAIVQIPGPSSTCEPDMLKAAARKSEKLHSMLIRHEQAVYAQAQQSTACNVTHHVDTRLARWMLRARDLAQSDTLPFTQEFLAEMLGVGRPRVSLVAHNLQQAGLIKYSRGRIQIVNAEGLKEVACECYETIKGHYAALLGGV